MSKINVGKVVIGGLVTGIVLNIGEAVLNTVVLADAMKQEFDRLKLPDLTTSTSFLIRVTGMTFLLGIAIVYLYSAIRPRFGAGWKTAACAGALAWFFVYLYAGYLYVAVGLVSMKPYLIGVVWGIIEFALAAIAGAYFYKEE
jgi:hypothetical protein